MKDARDILEKESLVEGKAFDSKNYLLICNDIIRDIQKQHL